MTYWILSLFSFLALAVVFYRRLNIARHSSINRGIIIEETPVSPDEKEVTAEQAEVLSKSIPLNEHLQMRDLFRRAEAFFTSAEEEKIDEAEKLYIQVLSFNENHTDANSRLGFIYLKKNLPLKAEAVYQKLIVLEPKNSSFYSNLALALYLQRKYEEARDHYLKAIELDPGRPQRFLNLAHVYRDLSLFPEALDAVQKASSLDPQNNEYRLMLAEIYHEMHQLEEAQTILQNILKHESKESELRPVVRLLLKRIEKAK